MWVTGQRSSCGRHACWRTAPGGYCIAPRCYCGGCPWYVPIHPAAADQAAAVLRAYSARRRRNRGR
jgi:hypothetical protein